MTRNISVDVQSSLVVANFVVAVLSFKSRIY